MWLLSYYVNVKCVKKKTTSTMRRVCNLGEEIRTKNITCLADTVTAL